MANKFLISRFLFLLGLQADVNSGNGNPEGFNFVDGSTEGREFFLTGGVFPWKQFEPNNFESAENCVE